MSDKNPMDMTYEDFMLPNRREELRKFQKGKTAFFLRPPIVHAELIPSAPDAIEYFDLLVHWIGTHGYRAEFIRRTKESGVVLGITIWDSENQRHEVYVDQVIIFTEDLMNGGWALNIMHKAMFDNAYVTAGKEITD